MSYLAEISRSVTPYDPADRPALRAFQAKYFGTASRQCDDRFFEWLFERNPARNSHAATLWLCKRDGVVVGQQASVPVMLKVGERCYRAAWGIDLMVHERWRMRGVGPALSVAFEQSAEILLGAGMSDAARRAFLRRDWKDTGFLPFFARPLDLKACAPVTLVPKVLARLTPSVLIRGSACGAAWMIGTAARASLERITAFDERSDEVWDAASADFSVIVRRDLPYLRWRFDEIPVRGAYDRYYLIRKGEVLGYAVTRIAPWRDTTAARVVDYLAPRRWLRALLALIIEELNSRRVAAIFIEQRHGDAEGILRMLGCVRVPSATRFILKVHGSALLARSLLSEAGQWYMSLADSDLDHEAAYAAGPVSERPEPGSSNA